MAGTILRVSVILAFVAAATCIAAPALAQVAPTNTASVSGNVNDSTGRPVANATVSLRGPKNASTRTDSQGLFVFVGIPFGTYSISVAAANLGTAARTGIVVQGDINVAIQFAPASNLKTIASVNSNASAGFNVTPASVTQVSPMAAALNGQTSWRKILERIPGVSQAGLLNGYCYFAGAADSPLVPIQVSINGTLPYETATLFDDMPLIGGDANQAGSKTAGTGTNLAAYALNGFDSADVVRGPGANSPSIVDSIGGSFVLHPAGVVAQNRYVLSLSTDPYGGTVTNTLIALRANRLSATMTYGVNSSPGPASGAQYTPITQGRPLSIDGFACSPTSCNFQTLTDPRFTSAFSSPPTYGYQSSLLTCCINQSTAWNQHGGSISLNYQISNSVSASVFYAGQSSVVLSAGPGDLVSIFTPPAGYTGSIPAGQSFYLYTNQFLTPSHNAQGSSLLEEKVTARVGRGVLRFAALQNRTFQTMATTTPATGTFQLFGGANLCLTPPCSTASPLPPGMSAYTPVVFNGETHTVLHNEFTNTFAYTSNNRDLYASYATELGANFHIGGSFVKSYYDIPWQCFAGSFSPTNVPLFTTSISFPSDVSETTNESRVFVGGNLSPQTSVDLSMYFTGANYHVVSPSNAASHSDVNYSYSAPRLGFVWRPTGAVAVRASAGGGFAEAPLQTLVGTNGTPALNKNLNIYTATFTNLNLQPEKSFSFDIGADIRARNNTILSFDVYRSNLYGQFYSSTMLSGTFNGLPLYVTQNGNLGQSRYEGVLLEARRDVPRGVYWSLSGGLTRGYVMSVPAGFYNGRSGFPSTPCTNCANLNVVPGPNFNGTYTYGGSVPYAQGLGTIGYRWNPQEFADLTATYFGNNNGYYRPAFAEFDGHLSYPVSKIATLLLTARNITGIYGGAYSIISPDNIIGMPTITGLPFPEFGEQYGPRTVLLTLRIER